MESCAKTQKNLTTILAFFVMQLLWLSFQQQAEACSVCFYGSPEEKSNMALNQGIIFMLIMLVIIFICFITFFLNFYRRSKKL